MAFYMGPHVHFQGDFNTLIDIHKLSGNNFFQIFRKNEEKVKNLDKFLIYAKKKDIKLVVHASYTNNIAEKWDQNSFWIINLIDEIEFANKVGAFGIVIHFGKSMQIKISEAYNNMFTCLIYLHNQTLGMKNVKLILETPAGQGTEMCSKFEDLQYFYNKFKINPEIYDRVKLCIDTCHIFAAGYNIKVKKVMKEYLKNFDKTIGISNLVLVHLNDSRSPLNGKLDRHEILGKGYIGKNGIIHFFKFCKKYNVPMIIETYSIYKKEIEFLLKSIEDK